MRLKILRSFPWNQKFQLNLHWQKQICPKIIWQKKEIDKKGQLGRGTKKIKWFMMRSSIYCMALVVLVFGVKLYRENFSSNSTGHCHHCNPNTISAFGATTTHGKLSKEIEKKLHHDLRLQQLKIFLLLAIVGVPFLYLKYYWGLGVLKLIMLLYHFFKSGGNTQYMMGKKVREKRSQ